MPHPALRALVAVVLVLGAAWALFVPPFQVPDEDAHFAYVQTLVEDGRRPADDGRPAREAMASTAQERAELASGFLDSAQRIEEKPEWTEGEWRRLRGGPRGDGGGANPASGNPPLYYLYAAPAYALARSGSTFDQLTVMRLWSVPLLALFAVAGWLLAGELVGLDRRAQLVAGAVCGLAPMASFIGSAVTPDALILPLWGFAFWLIARVAQRGGDAPGPAPSRAGRRRDIVALLLVVLAACAVKPVSVALIPGVVLALAGRRIPVRLVLAACLLAAVAAAVAVPGGPRRFASYLWQFYSPVDAGAAAIPQLPSWPLRDVWLEGTVGSFGWLEVRLPGWIYLVAAVVIVATVLVARPRLPLALLLPALALLAGLHVTEEWFLVRDGDPFTQGRYLLPLLPLAGVVAGLAVRRLPRPALGLALGALMALQLASLAAVAGRFYA